MKCLKAEGWLSPEQAKVQLSEVQGVCNRLAQDNTELIEKMKGMVRLPREKWLTYELYTLFVPRFTEHDVYVTEYSFQPAAQKLLGLLKGEK